MIDKPYKGIAKKIEPYKVSDKPVVYGEPCYSFNVLWWKVVIVIKILIFAGCLVYFILGMLK